MIYGEEWTEDNAAETIVPGLIPSESGMKCPANGTHEDIEICCDECRYFLFCFPTGSFPDGE